MWARARRVLRAVAERWALPQRCLFCGGGNPREGICVRVPARFAGEPWAALSNVRQLVCGGTDLR